MSIATILRPLYEPTLRATPFPFALNPYYDWFLRVQCLLLYLYWRRQWSWSLGSIHWLWC